MRQFKIMERYTTRTEGIQRYLNEVSQIDMITPDEEYQLAVKASKGDENAVEQLVKVNLRFVVSVAKQYAGTNSYKLEDLINEGNHGLIEAARLFNPETGFKFISFAIWHIRKYILKYLTDHSRHVRLPQNKAVAANKMKQIESDLSHILERIPTREEVLDKYIELETEEKGYKPRRKSLEMALNADLGTAALELPTDSDDDKMLSPIDYINGDNKGSDHIVMDSSLDSVIHEYINRLGPLDRQIVLLRLGFIDFERVNPTWKEIGHYLNISGETARGKYEKSIKRLRIFLRRDGIKIENLL